jgi:hypothetical protein
MEIDRNVAEQKVRAPAIGIIATAGLGALLQVASILMTLTGAMVPQLESSDAELPDWYGAFAGTWGVVSGVVGIAVAGFLIWGALKMMRLEGWGIALTVCILALVPCVSPCCLLGLPFGIWGLVVINDQAVKQAFR